MWKGMGKREREREREKKSLSSSEEEDIYGMSGGVERNVDVKSEVYVI